MLIFCGLRPKPNTRLRNDVCAANVATVLRKRFWPVPLLMIVLPLMALAEDSRKQSPAGFLLVEDAIATAIEGNPGLAEMRARYEALAEIPSQLGTLPDPVLSINAMNLPTDTFSLGQEAMTQMQLGISQTIPFPGKLALRADASEFEAVAAGFSVDEVRLLLVRNVRSRWWQLYFLDRSLEIVDSNQGLLRQFIEVAMTKYEVGGGLQQDVLLAQLELSKLFEQEITLNAARRNQSIQLNVLMDKPPNEMLALPPKVSLTMRDIANENLLYEKAEAIRPLLRKKENNIRAAQSRLDLARKQYYPDFELSVTYGDRSGDNPLPRGGSRADFLSVMFSFNLPIYSKRKVDRVVSQRGLELQKQRYSLRDEWGVVRAEISTANTDYAEARERFELYRSGIIPQARQTVAAMLAGYQVSEVDFLNLVGSQVTLLKYELQYWKAFTEANQALARLDAAVGEDAGHE